MSRIHFIKKLTKEELCKEIYNLIENDTNLTDDLDSDTDLTKPDEMEYHAHEVYLALRNVDKSKFKGIVGSLEVDTENLSGSSKDFGEPDFVGFHTLPNGLTYLGICMGGDWETPMYTCIFHDGGDTVYEVIPEDGNTFNTATHAAYGNDQAADAENITIRIIKGQYAGVDIDDMPTTKDDTEEAMEVLGDTLASLIKPRVSLMHDDIMRDVLFFDTEKEAGQMIETPDGAGLHQALEESDLDKNFKEELVNKIVEAVDNDEAILNDTGSLSVSDGAVQKWMEENPPDENLTEEEQKEMGETPLYRIRKHFKEALPKDFPVAITGATGEVFFKPGGEQEGDQDGGDFGELTKEDNIEKFKELNDLRRRLNLQRIAGNIADASKQIADMTGFYKELSDIDMELLEKEAKEREGAKEEDDGNKAGPQPPEQEEAGTEGTSTK
jgi:hypothetical protein